MPTPSALVPEHSTELPSGRRLGRYLVRRRLGAGGFARVYLALDPDLEIEVAIKIPKPQLADDAGAIDRFRREATTAARLRHPNVVTVLTVGRLDEAFDGAPGGAPYLVMDYLPETLTGRLAATPVLPEHEWLRIGEQVARGLAYAHAHGVVHRDVKPDNILFGRHGEAVVTDFGIARAVIEGAAPASRSIIVGTPEYFSPEQARGLPLDGRTDIYGLGVTLYRAATGVLPFTGTDWYAIMRQHVEDQPPPPRSLNADLSKLAESVILRCLAKAPADRFQSAAEVAAALAAAAHPAGRMLATGSATVDLTAPTRVVPLSAVARRTRRTVARVAALAVVLTIGGGIGTMALLQRHPAQGAIVPPPTQPQEPVIPFTPIVPNDSAVVTRQPVRETLPATAVAARTNASLSVQAPGNAMITVNERPVGSGSWRYDSLDAGVYTVKATVPSLANCPTAIDVQSVDMARGQRRSIRLQPRACGTLNLDVSPARAHFELAGPGPAVSGQAPLAAPLVVPGGDYRLIITAAFCAKYDDSIHVTTGRPNVERVRLICTGKGL